MGTLYTSPAALMQLPGLSWDTVLCSGSVRQVHIQSFYDPDQVGHHMNDKKCIEFTMGIGIPMISNSSTSYQHGFSSARGSLRGDTTPRLASCLHVVALDITQKKYL